MQLPPILVPVLEQVQRRIFFGNVPLDFWQIDSGPRILNGFMNLAGALMLSDLREVDVPRGYLVLAVLFSWEGECQGDGWGAFGNVGEAEFERICKFYREVGLGAEASSLIEQMRAYEADPQDLPVLYRAASSTCHPLSGDLDRLEYLTQYFCDHASELLYAGA